MIFCPRCQREMIWNNDYDHGDGSDETYTDYSCECGVMVTIPWEREDEEEGEEEA